MKTPQSNTPNRPPPRGRTKRGNTWTPVRVPGSEQGFPANHRAEPPAPAVPGAVPTPEGEDELSAYRQTNGG